LRPGQFTKEELAAKIGCNFSYQLDFIKNESQFEVINKARQIGMSSAIACRELLNFLLKDEYVCIIVSPTQRQSDRIKRYIDKYIIKLERLFGQKIELKKNRQDHLISEGDSEIWSFPNNLAGVQGIDADKVIIDEVALFETREGQDMYEATLGSLAAKGGGMCLSSRPRGRRGAHWETWNDAPENSYRRIEIPWQLRAEEDPKYGVEVLKHKKLLRHHPNQFRELYECAFVDENLLVFPYELLEEGIDKNLKLLHDGQHFVNPRENQVYMGIDFARRQDKTSIVVAELADDTYIVRYIYDTRSNFDRQTEEIIQINSRFKPDQIFLDETGLGLPMLDVLRNKLGPKVQGIVFTAKNKERLIIDLRNRLSERKIKLPDDNDLLSELHSIEKKSLPETGRVVYICPKDESGHADRAFALMLCTNSFERHGAFNAHVIQSKSTYGQDFMGEDFDYLS